MSIQLKPVPLTARVADLFNNAASKVNKWAKFKPVHFPAWFMTDEERNRPTTYNGHTLSNGLIVPRYQGIAAFKAAIDDSDGDNYYTYVPPTGGAASPLRMFDVISTSDPEKGYDPEAKRPIAGIHDSVTQENYIISFDMNVQTGNHVKLGDLVADGDTENNLTDYYLGALLVDKASGTIEHTHINTSSFSSLSTITIPRSVISASKTYVCYPFFANASSVTSALYLSPIEGVGKYEFSISNNFTVAARAYWLDPTTRNAAYLQWSVTSHVANLRKTVMLYMINASTGATVGNHSEVSISLNAGESYPTTGVATWNVGNLQSGTNYKFRIIIDTYQADISILTRSDI